MPEKALTAPVHRLHPRRRQHPAHRRKGVTFCHTRLSWGIGLTLYPGEDLDARAGLGETNGPFADC